MEQTTNLDPCMAYLLLKNAWDLSQNPIFSMKYKLKCPELWFSTRN